MSAFRSIVFVIVGVVVGLLVAQVRRPLNVAAQERKPRVVVTVVGNDPRGNPIYLVARPGTGACWIGVAGDSSTLLSAPELAGACR